MKPIILTDLDDTVFTTMKNYAGFDPADLRQVTTAKNGNHSYLCSSRQAVLDFLMGGADLLPVTARSLDAFRRVSIDFGGHGAVLANGAMILNPDGTEDRIWRDLVETLCSIAHSDLQAVKHVIKLTAAPVRIHPHMNGRTLLGMTVKSNVETDEGVATYLSEVEGIVERLGETRSLNFVTHRNGNNLAFVPNGVSKREAVEYLLATRSDLQNRPTIGAGDSLSDLPFMQLCDMMILPRDTQASAKLFA